MNKKFLSLAVGSAIAFGGAFQAANSQFLDLGGLGDKLLGSYYTVNNNNETYIGVVNTTGEAKAIKVRFREGRGSIDVLDFHVYLSPYDMWGAAITVNSRGEPVLISADTSCTVPRIGSDADAPLLPLGEEANATPRPGLLSTQFIPAIYGGDADQRVREGYIEIIDMASFGPVPEVQDQPTGYNTRAGQWSAGQPSVRMNAADFRWATKHVMANGTVDGVDYVNQMVPRDCAAVRAFNTRLLNPTNVAPGNFAGQPPNAQSEQDIGNPASMANENFRAPTGGLFGNVSIINVGRSTMVSYEMDAINSGFDQGNGNIFFTQNISPAANLTQWTADRGQIFEKNRNLSYFDLPDLSTATDTGGDPTNTVNYYYNTTTVQTNLGNVPLTPTPTELGAAQLNIPIMDVRELLVPISNALAASAIQNEYVTDFGLEASTDWVVTHPTKRFHSVYAYDRATGEPLPAHRASTLGLLPGQGTSNQTSLRVGWNGWIEPFRSGFNQATGLACDPVTIKAWDRDERVPAGVLDFSPGQVGDPRLCYEMNVVSFNEPFTPGEPSNTLGGIDTRVNINIPGSGDTGFPDPTIATSTFQNGWAEIGLPGSAGTELGRPVHGFMAYNLVNTEVQPGVMGFYGASFKHRYVGRRQPGN